MRAQDHLARVEQLAQQIAQTMRDPAHRKKRTLRRQSRALLTRCFQVTEAARVAIIEAQRAETPEQPEAIPAHLAPHIESLGAIAEELTALVDAFEGRAPLPEPQAPAAAPTQPTAPPNTSAAAAPSQAAALTGRTATRADEATTRTREAATARDTTAPLSAPEALASPPPTALDDRSASASAPSEETNTATAPPPAQSSASDDAPEVPSSDAKPDDEAQDVLDPDLVRIAPYFEMIGLKFHHQITLRAVNTSPLMLDFLKSIEEAIDRRQARINKILELIGVEQRSSEGDSLQVREGYTFGLLDGADTGELIKRQKKKKRKRPIYD